LLVGIHLQKCFKLGKQLFVHDPGRGHTLMLVEE